VSARQPSAKALRDALPNLIVVGAMKCGTTALHRILSLHPEVSMAAPKEMNFFVGPARPRDGAGRWAAGNWHRGLDWYAGHFEAAKVRGEASPAYTSPSFPDAAARMASVVPDARLIYLVREPVQRALSQYVHHRRDGTEPRPVEEALLDENSQYLARSRYHARLLPFTRHYPRSRIMICLQEDLLSRPRETRAALFRFAGVDDSFSCAEYDGPSRPSRLSIDSRLERRLTAALAADLTALRQYAGRDFDEWGRRPATSPGAGLPAG
jgi:hypothetical protein